MLCRVKKMLKHYLTLWKSFLVVFTDFLKKNTMLLLEKATFSKVVIPVLSPRQQEIRNSRLIKRYEEYLAFREISKKVLSKTLTHSLRVAKTTYRIFEIEYVEKITEKYPKRYLCRFECVIRGLGIEKGIVTHTIQCESYEKLFSEMKKVIQI